jgi:hypothetical protein
MIDGQYLTQWRPLLTVIMDGPAVQRLAFMIVGKWCRRVAVIDQDLGTRVPSAGGAPG